MAVCFHPPTSLQPRTVVSYAQHSSLSPSGQGCQTRRRPKQATIQLQRRATSLNPLCAARSNEREDSHGQTHSVPPSPLGGVAADFYSSLNKKNLARLHQLVADDCVFEDLSFSKTFKGKETHQYLKNLTEAMGKGTEFITDGIYEGKNSSFAVQWHLEWQRRRIPFARGCSVYDCSTKNDALLIKKATVYVESPLPGEFALQLLKIIGKIFDMFPKPAKWLLEKHHVMMQLVIFILPLWAYRTNLWTFGARILGVLLHILQKLLKIYM